MPQTSLFKAGIGSCSQFWRTIPSWTFSETNLQERRNCSICHISMLNNRSSVVKMPFENKEVHSHSLLPQLPDKLLLDSWLGLPDEDELGLSDWYFTESSSFSLGSKAEKDSKGLVKICKNRNRSQT